MLKDNDFKPCSAVTSALKSTSKFNIASLVIQTQMLMTTPLLLWNPFFASNTKANAHTQTLRVKIALT